MLPQPRTEWSLAPLRSSERETAKVGEKLLKLPLSIALFANLTAGIKR
jgi:hypothetical protein